MKFVALDVDGTLVDSRGILVPVVKESLLKAWPQVGIIFASGRPASGVRHIQDQLGKEGPFIALNGAVVSDCCRTIRVLSSPLSLPIIAAIHDTCKDFKMSIDAIFAYSRKRWLAYGIFDAIHRESVATHCVPEVFCDMERVFRCSAIKLTVVCNNDSTRRRLCARMLRGTGGMCQIEQSKRDYVEITSRGVSKGEALMHLLAAEKYRHVVAVGDGVNDISMFDVSSEAYAMPWAVDKVKKAATQIIRKPGHANLAKLIGAIAKSAQETWPRDGGNTSKLTRHRP